MTTLENITPSQIETLRDEAAAHGDQEQVRICNQALTNDMQAIQECVEAIQAAENMG